MTDDVTITTQREADAGHGPDPEIPQEAGDPAAVAVPVAEDSQGNGGGDTSGEASELRAERDHYLELLRRVQAEFENYRKRVRRDHHDEAARAAAEVVARLLPVFDAVDAAVEQHPHAVGPLRSALHLVGEQLGLERFAPTGEAFDPDVHEAVERETGDGPEREELIVTEVLRPGYRFKGRLLRPAMVAVRG